MPLPDLAPIESPRLTLRPVVGADLADLLAVNGDPEVTRFLPYTTWRSMDDAVAWLGRMEALATAGTGQQLVVERRSDAKVIGTVLLFKHDEPSRRVELGYALGRADWGQGCMREALGALCTRAFASGQLRRLEAEVNPANRASCRLLESLGFALEGRLRQRWVAQGVAYDTRLYGLLADDGHG
ncbi:MAG TPA: GNAT family N-acetyltransferase [Methylibium sp.]|nr:GNAT family N-acetyltransferase [Methylibium sp.]